MSEKKTAKDYVIAGLSFCVIVVPEVLKICMMVFYATLFYLSSNIIENTDTASFDTSQKLLVGFMLLISPIGAYFFYDKTVIPKVYSEVTKYLSQTKSVLKFIKTEDENDGPA